MKCCCVCGLRRRRGVIWGFTGAVRMTMFACEECFAHHSMFFPCKVYERPTWLMAIPLDKWLMEAEEKHDFIVHEQGGLMK